VDSLILQNFPDCDNEELKGSIKPRFRSRPRGQRRCHLVVEVEGKIRKELLKKGKVFILYEALTIKDFMAVTRCFKCNDLGHIEINCSGPIRCGHSAREFNKRVDCPTKDKQGVVCIPCHLRGLCGCEEPGVPFIPHSARKTNFKG